MKKDTSTRLQELMDIKNINQVDLCQRTGIPKSSMSMYLSGERSPRQNRLSQIAEKFNISEAWLMGYDVPMERADSLSDETLSQKDKRDILDIISSTKAELLSQEGLMFDGDPASPEAIESILNAMEIGMEMAKKKNKEKYTPKKYKKD
ncbi:MAG: helix-turn-helix transcriptional regulator [Anaerostipes hadrus]|nr:helix-turn-helix transcriptional regulator [Anaerostipes hadrus]